MKQIADYGHDTGENILWQPEENALYWLDIPAGQLFRGTFGNDSEAPESFRSTCILQMDEAIGGFVFRKATVQGRTSFLLFASAGRIYSWDYESSSPRRPELYCQLNPDLVPSRFNDVFALPAADSGAQRVLCGTMPSAGQADSRLLLFDVRRRSCAVVQQDLKLANGMGLSPRRDYLYFADTRDFAVFRFAVRNLQKVAIDWNSRQKWLDFQGRPGRPDGLCVDREGRVWVAETGAGIVSCFDPHAQELGHWEVGTPKITSCCFGGRSRDILFISTQGGAAEQRRAGEKAGGVFALSARDDATFAPDFRGQDETLI